MRPSTSRHHLDLAQNLPEKIKMLIEANPRYDEDDNFLIYTLKET